MGVLLSTKDFGYMHTPYFEVSRPRKVLPVLVEGDCHDSVRGIERLLYTVTMVNVNVNVEHPLMIPNKKYKTFMYACT